LVLSGIALFEKTAVLLGSVCSECPIAYKISNVKNTLIRKTMLCLTSVHLVLKALALLEKTLVWYARYGLECENMGVNSKSIFRMFEYIQDFAREACFEYEGVGCHTRFLLTTHGFA